ncbi:MAG: type II secretion system protein GspD [Akkermansiaceae bacterium]
MKLLIHTFFLICLTGILRAQDIPEVLPLEVPDNNPVQAEMPDFANKNIVDPDGMAAKNGQVIDGSNWDDQNIADEYSKYTGNRVLLSSATQDLEIRFYQRGPLTNREAATLLVKVLDMEGFVFVPSGRNEVKLLPKSPGAGSNGPGELEGIIDNEYDIPTGDDYISYFMKLNFIKPDEAVRTFTQSLHGLDAGAKIAPVANASAVLITGKAGFVRKLLNQKVYIDVPTGNVSTSWVQLNYADAEEVATTLNEIINSKQTTKTTASVTNNSGNNNQNNASPIPGVPNSGGLVNTNTGGNSTAAGEDIPVQIVANTRLNKIFIMGRPVDIIFVESLAREFDAPPSKSNYLKRKLRFMIASDFLDVASKALESLNGSSSTGGTSTNGTQNRNQTTNNTNGNTGTGNGVSEFDVSDKPEAIVIGKTFIVADNLANSILVQGPPESVRVISELMDKLDGRPQQVMISAVFGSIGLDEGKDTGVGFGRTGSDVAGGAFNGTGTSILDLTTLTDVSTLSTSLVASSGGLNVYGAYKDFAATLVALQNTSNFKTLARPTIFTANNRRGIISSGSRIAVPSNTTTTNGVSSTSIEYIDVLLQLEVVPLINSDDEVTLNISLLNEGIDGFTIVGENQIDTIVTESIETIVTIPNDATVVLGGLITEREEDSRVGVPILSSIPGIGRLFRRDTKDVSRDELLVFIRPTILNNPESQRKAQSELERSYEVSKEALEFANDVLPKKPAIVVEEDEAQASSLRFPTRR